MGDTAQRERDLAVDLESGGTTSDEDGPRDVVPGITKAKKLLGRVWKGEGALNSANYSELNSSDASVDNLGLLAPDKKLGGEEKVGKDVKRETPRKKSGKKPPKPPRPPKSPSLDAADKKLVKEINELAMLKRARMERMKALKKMKAAKAASSGSSSSNLCAMVITILFCLIIILQGAFSRGHSSGDFVGSPESSGEMTGGLISVQYYRNAVASSSNGPAPGSESPNVVQRVSGLGTQEGSRAPE
ncbi:hypothetical protein CKAN_02363000 [Cinnamomum micranthum f. kanehirae]|uniref:Transmembrane protein n=1 Tax=Cinnamomum micranthum f. kanehirae TaxID=337451 RepID=A0A3S3R4K9_9MAGN|nr:hypothetical protein CKAN_02363000 [Cinnamomum micranthum f. kanehirae]